MRNLRAIHAVLHGDAFHWVGDGFRVANYFPSGNAIGARLSPFILMDYHPPYEYTPSEIPRGVGPHPHRGFETVTLAFEGSVAHHDSTGGGGVIGPGDAQWMTAGSGILHKEYHEAEFSKRGGTMHMMQLWVNLPKADKMTVPRYQGLLSSQMGNVVLDNNAGTVRVIAGTYQGVTGPAKTFTRIELWEVRLNEGGRMEMSFPEKDNAALLVMNGSVRVNGATSAANDELVVFENQGEDIVIEATTKTRLLVLGGEAIGDPVVQYGPFVMTSEQEIRQALFDFNNGKFGYLA